MSYSMIGFLIVCRQTKACSDISPFHLENLAESCRVLVPGIDMASAGEGRGLFEYL